jgi:hypothetical protein
MRSRSFLGASGTDLAIPLSAAIRRCESWESRVRKATPAAVRCVVMLGVLAGLYAFGPKSTKSYGQTVSILCIDGRMANFVWEPAPVASAKTSPAAPTDRAARSSDGRPPGSASNCGL